MIMTYANARGLKLGELRVDCVYDAETTPRHVELVVHAPAGLTQDQIKRLHRIADTCPVKRALEAGFAFDERIVVDRDPSGEGELATVNDAPPARGTAS
jgi:uncharacterized OsmC-like protein